MAITEKEIKKVLANPHTKTLVESVDRMKQYTRSFVSPQFFHPSHSEQDRVVICVLLQNYFGGRIDREGKDLIYYKF
jgi:hypothetical protein